MRPTRSIAVGLVHTPNSLLRPSAYYCNSGNNVYNCLISVSNDNTFGLRSSHKMFGINHSLGLNGRLLLNITVIQYTLSEIYRMRPSTTNWWWALWGVYFDYFGQNIARDREFTITCYLFQVSKHLITGPTFDWKGEFNEFKMPYILINIGSRTNLNEIWSDC